MLPWQNTSAPLSVRVASLLSLLTVDELVDQLGGPSISSINRACDACPEKVLAVPGYTFGLECLAGVAQAKVSTAFPLPANLGASFDTQLVHDVASAIGDEARALYNAGELGAMHCLGPVLNLARDPRWGRSYESYGEDPLLISRLGEAYVHGMSHGPGAANVSDARGYAKMGAVAKHAAAYNFEGCVGSEGWPNCSRYRTRYNARVDAIDMHESYLPAWRRVAPLLEGAMCSYNAINGVPACASAPLLEQTLRGEYGLDGMIVADDGAIARIYDHAPDGGHRFAPSPTEAALMALSAGVDVAYGDGYSVHMRMLNLSRAALAPPVARSLATRFRLGVFDPPASNPWSSLQRQVVDSKQHRTLARRAAVESAVLLHNAPTPHGLPLAPLATAPMVVLGSAANDTAVLRGNYNGNPSHTVTYLQGLTARANSTVKYYGGTSPAGAAAAARGASAVVAAVRSTAESESHDRASLTVRPADAAMLRALCSLPAARVVVVVVSGGPVDVSEWIDSSRCATPAAAVVAAGLGGEEGGSAFASLLFGDEDFSAFTSTTVYRDAFTAAADVADASLRSPVGRGYRYVAPQYVLFPFGYGLSYARWEAAPVGTFEPAAVGAAWLVAQPRDSAPIRLRVALRNLGERRGARPVLLYLRRLDPPPAAYGSWPRRWLVNFTKVHGVASGATAVVDIGVGAEALSRWSAPDGGWTAPGRLAVVPGRYAAELSDGEAAAAAPCILTVHAG